LASLLKSAAIASVHTPLPTKTVSTKLYKAITSIHTTAGADCFANNFHIFSSHKCLGLLFIV